MKISKQEMFDALTSYYQNDWRKTGQMRCKGIQVGKSNWYVIRHNVKWANLIIRAEKDYDLSKFGFDFQTGRGRGTQWNVHWNFAIGEVKTVAKRKEFSEFERLMNHYEDKYLKECA